MVCRITDLHNKEVINLCDGCRLGCVDDVEVDTATSCVKALVIFGRLKLFGLLGREEDVVICWDEIEVIGDDTILIRRNSSPKPRHRRPSLFGGLFSR